jgi:guanylate kinase
MTGAVMRVEVVPVIFIVSGPGGVGKGTIVKDLVTRDPLLWLSRSWTTRPRRPGEDADAYVFVTPEEFRRRADAGGFLEWVEFLGNFYGTPMPKAPHGKDLLLEIELVGAKKVHATHPEAVIVLVVPPSIEIQRERLRRRGDPPERIEERVEKGRREMETGREIADEIVVNDDLETAVRALGDIVSRYRSGNGAAQPAEKPRT